jgi:hypothetical protein
MTTHEEFYIDFWHPRERTPEQDTMQGMNGPYPSLEALTAAWGEPTDWEPPLKIMKRTVTVTDLEDI